MITIIEFISDIRVRKILRLLNFFNLRNRKEEMILPKDEYKKNEPN
jgi:hypothetical protein